jgi:hypothetical protein
VVRPSQPKKDFSLFAPMVSFLKIKESSHKSES